MTLLEEFRAFVKGKPANEEYSFISIHNCAIAQFARARHGEDFNSAGSSSYSLKETAERIILFDPFSPEAAALICSRTFGELSAELEALA